VGCTHPCPLCRCGLQVREGENLIAIKEKVEIKQQDEVGRRAGP
jgi:hypothetical protein